MLIYNPHKLPHLTHKLSKIITPGCYKTGYDIRPAATMALDKPSIRPQLNWCWTIKLPAPRCYINPDCEIQPGANLALDERNLKFEIKPNILDSSNSALTAASCLKSPMDQSSTPAAMEVNPKRRRKSLNTPSIPKLPMDPSWTPADVDPSLEEDPD